jgi:biopolymer transport protein ExbB/TolQ
MEFLNKTLFLLSDGMLIPVMIMLILFFIRSLFLIGGFFRLAIQRTQSSMKRSEAIRKLDSHQTKSQHCLELCTGSSFFDKTAKALVASTGKTSQSEKILAEAELHSHKECEQARMIMRIGPMLGLMGTIIPMGPALTGLASGNISAMALNMQVAFATTVIGLFCGITGFVLNSILRRWFAEDMINLNYVCEVLNERK